METLAVEEEEEEEGEEGEAKSRGSIRTKPWQKYLAKDRHGSC